MDASNQSVRGSREALLSARQLRKVFPSVAEEEIVVLDGVDLELRRGEMLAVVGESGVGKSTLLYVLAGLDHPSAGSVLFEDKPLHALSADELANHRSRNIGFVWQLSNLLPDFTARENVALPLLVRGVGQEDARRTAEQWLREVGVGARADHLVGELSGGEQQRVALARALVTSPSLLFADEPTGNLDEATGEKIFGVLKQLHATHGLTSLLATHNLALAGRCDRILRLEQGRLTAPGA